jgi:hypothetical protein
VCGCICWSGGRRLTAIVFSLTCLLLTALLAWLLLLRVDAVRPQHGLLHPTEHSDPAVQGDTSAALAFARFCHELVSLVLLLLGGLFRRPKRSSAGEGPLLVWLDGGGWHGSALWGLALWLERKGFRPLRLSGSRPHSLESLDAAAEALERAVEETCLQSGIASIQVVAAGSGGLVARWWLEQHGTDAGRSRVDHLLTLGTPHAGIQKTWCWPGEGRLLSSSSPWLKQLQESLANGPRVPYTSIASRRDTLQDCPYPPAALGHVRVLWVDVSGPYSLFFSARTWQLVRHTLLRHATRSAVTSPLSS